MKTRATSLLLLFLTTATIVFGAKDDKKKKIEDLYGGIQFGADFGNFTNLENNDLTSFSYMPRFSYNFGFELVKQFNDYFLISSGFNFRTISFSRTEVCNTCGEQSFEVYSDFNAKYREIPLKGIFVISNQKLDVLGTVGLINSFRSRVDQKRVAYDGRIENFNASNAYKAYLLSLELGIGFNYSINYDFSWGMNIYYRQPFSQFSTINYPALKFWNIGVNTGFYYHF